MNERKRRATEWKNNPDPPETYGQSGPNVLTESLRYTTWIWSLTETEEYLTFYGDSMSIER